MPEKISKKIAECKAKVDSLWWVRTGTRKALQQMVEILDEMNKTIEKIK